MTKNSLIGFVTEKEGPTEKKEGEYKDGFHIMYPRIALNYEMRYLVIDKLREELRNDNLIDIITPLRSGASDKKLKDLIKKAIDLKEPFYKE